MDGREVAVKQLRHLEPAFHYGLLFDTSRSEVKVFNQQKAQAIALLSKVPQPSRDFGSLVAFNHEVALDAEGDDPQRLIAAVSRERVGGGTAVYDAITACANRPAKIAPAAPQRFMFLFTDGGDNLSHVTPDETSDALTKAGVHLFAIGRFDEPVTTRIMQRLADESGGKVFLFGKRRTSLVL